VGIELMFRHFWLVFVGVTILNARYWWAGVQARIQALPELEPGYRRLFRGFLFWANVPWLLMGAGILSGQVRWMFDFLEPRNGNPYVLAWWWANGAILAVATAWVLWGGGAEMLARHPGFAMVPEWSASQIRWLSMGLVAWNVTIGGFLLFWNPASTGGAPLPFPTEWAPILIPLFAVALIYGVNVLAAWLGGWAILARHYRASRDHDGRRLRFRSARFGAVSYGRCLTLTVSAEGLGVAILPVFRAVHPPLFFPWGDVAARAGRTWLFTWIELTFAQSPGIDFRISRRLAEAVARESGGRLRLPPTT
jgi:hypothetical protein